ncbi:MAG: hypothetical protein GX637_07115 [Clostridiales bacterium]|nr:hypothetical protein [Clostridiales bacterium]
MNILLLGDSVRMQYQKPLTEMLSPAHAVFGPEENGRFSAYLLNSLRFWLPQLPSPDIVQFNCGLWDMGDDYQEGRHFILPDLYRENCVRICRVLRKITGKADLPLIIATTTPTRHADHQEIGIYNGILREVAQAESARINDLYAVIDRDRENLIGPDGIHLSEAGIAAAAEQTAAVLREYF